MKDSSLRTKEFGVAIADRTKPRLHWLKQKEMVFSKQINAIKYQKIIHQTRIVNPQSTKLSNKTTQGKPITHG